LPSGMSCAGGKGSGRLITMNNGHGIHGRTRKNKIRSTRREVRAVMGATAARTVICRNREALNANYTCPIRVATFLLCK
jgi:hypothetical protein